MPEFVVASANSCASIVHPGVNAAGLKVQHHRPALERVRQRELNGLPARVAWVVKSGLGAVVKAA